MSEHDNHTAKLFSRRKMTRASLTIVVGTAAAVMAAGTARAGYGPCSKDNCPAYQGSADLCGNCGHHYRDHW